MSKPVREPINIIEDKLIRIKNIPFKLSATIYEPWVKKDKEGKELPLKAHERVGFASIQVGDVLQLNNISVFLNTEKKEYWLAFPNKMVKGKFKGINYIPKETSEIFNNYINKINEIEEIKENTLNDVPYEMEL